ncbi:STAS domain-containing protein [Cryptosporangium minutisporangium]|uniref:STAS domain-containing protein n=1 Tax=Cryptosporangium minutisporangium TaxID=113569 RepID=A0ABP6T6B8_9ACTN
MKSHLPGGQADAAPLLRASVKRIGASHVRVRLIGEADRSSSAHLTKAVTAALHHNRPDVIDLDLAEVRFIDAGGVGAVVEARQHCAAANCRLRLTDPQPFVRTVLRLTEQWDVG